MHVSRSTKSFDSYSWQGWRSIYNSHIVFKISPTMIWVHRKQAMLVDAQSHLHKITRQNIFWDKNLTMSIKFFGFSTFYVVFGFLTYKKEKIDQRQQCKNILNKRMQKKNKQFSIHIINKQTNRHTTKHSHTT